MQRIAEDRSLWLLARQPDAAVQFVVSLQERVSVRKAAAAAAEIAEQASKASSASQGGIAPSCPMLVAGHTSAARAEPRTSAQRGTRAEAVIVASTGPGLGVSSTSGVAADCQKDALSMSQAAMRVQSLKEELQAAEAVVVELRQYLAEAEEELAQEQRDEKS